MTAMRRILAVNLLLALLTAMSGAVTPVVPCSVHAPGAAGEHSGHRMADVHRGPAKQESGSPHGPRGHSCICPGVCGRSGVVLGLHQTTLITPVLTETPAPPVDIRQFAPTPVAFFLPLATGPPQSLRT
jgi:hypothetical protein